MTDDLSRRLVPDELWALAQPFILQFSHPSEGGGTTPVDDRAVFTAIVFVLSSGCAWRDLPPSFGVTVPIARCRFTEWTNAGLWPSLHHAVLDKTGSQALIEWTRTVADGASIRAKNDHGYGDTTTESGRSSDRRGQAVDSNKKQRKRRVRRSNSLNLSVHDVRHDPPDIRKIAKVLIDLARDLDRDELQAQPGED